MTKYIWGHSRRYNDYSSYIRNHFGKRVQKISVSGGFTCPNRDGLKGRGGCTFCNNESFIPGYSEPTLPVKEQIQNGIDFFKEKYPEMEYLAYFQSYTNTYDEISKLKKLYEEALSHPKVIGLIIGTRPDCISVQLIKYFAELKERTYLVIEIGIESTNEKTLEIINRGHTYKEAEEMIIKLASHNITVGSHMILGLPGESDNDMLEHAERLSALPIDFLKLHQLQYVKGSQLGRDYLKNPTNFKVWKVDEYIDLVVKFIEIISPNIVLERFASETPKHLQIAPKWGLKNFELVSKIERELKNRDTYQGKLFS